MAAPRKYDDTTRRRILELHVHERRSAGETAEILTRAGTPISVHSVRQIAKDEKRQDLTERPKAQQLAALLAGLVQATNAEISRINGKNEPTDGDQLLKLARTIREIEPLLTDTPKGNKAQKPETLLGGLQDAATTQSTTKQEPHAALRSLSA
jgi:hypothetical protein